MVLVQRGINRNSSKQLYICIPQIDVKELNVLAELAMSSAAGQGDLEVEQVSCLHAAVTGYAPFIYDLPKEADFNHFMKHCSHVWHALDNDPNLPKKLVCQHNYNGQDAEETFSALSLSKLYNILK